MKELKSLGDITDTVDHLETLNIDFMSKAHVGILEVLIESIAQLEVLKILFFVNLNFESYGNVFTVKTVE